MMLTAFTFFAMPRGFLAAWAALLCLALPVRAAALGSGAVDWPVGGTGCDVPTACSVVAPSQHNFGAAVMVMCVPAPIGVTDNIAGGCRGTPAGIVGHARYSLLATRYSRNVP